ncbi:MAG: hypothetical protein EGQ84_02670, partial [Slackia sp.]|nr:hypothetical protein [Slackia sp.]
MAVVLGKQSALRVWDGIVAGQGMLVDQSAFLDRAAIAGRSVFGDQNAPASRGASFDRSTNVSPSAAAPSRGVPFAFQSSRDYRHALERDTKAAVRFLVSGAPPVLDPATKARFFADESPIHATVTHARFRRAGGGIEASVRKGPFHPQSFMRIEDGLYVSTPEMAFCEMANALSLEQLMALGFELCGTYRRASTFGSARYDATPLTSPGALAA